MWKIRPSDKLDRKVNKLRSNTEVFDGYKNALFELVRSADPESMGERKRGHLCHLYGYRITKPYRLLHHVDRDNREIVVVDLDDHKNVYGRD